MNINLIVKIVIGIVAYSSWAIMIYFDKAPTEAFVLFNQSAIVGLVTHVLSTQGDTKK